MIEDYLAAGAYKVTKAAVSLFYGVMVASPTIGAWPDGVTGRCKVTISSAIGHTDCAGTMTIGSETLTFIQAGTKQTTVSLTATPVITSSGLDCHCHITVIDVGGADVVAETLTAINTRIEAYNSGFYNSQGVWTKTNSLILSTTELQIGDIVRKGARDYRIQNAEDNPDLGQESDFYTYLA
ncbi:hypothetical protein M0R72_06955 [Candidatus Pacearchaeota archaeon]|jgi:hypothetical protein|nr:hypothetical protein [Candidatus Pacearchaeota archaeon]